MRKQLSIIVLIALMSVIASPVTADEAVSSFEAMKAQIKAEMKAEIEAEIKAEIKAEIEAEMAAAKAEAAKAVATQQSEIRIVTQPAPQQNVQTANQQRIENAATDNTVTRYNVDSQVLTGDAYARQQGQSIALNHAAGQSDQVIRSQEQVIRAQKNNNTFGIVNEVIGAGGAVAGIVKAFDGGNRGGGNALMGNYNPTQNAVAGAIRANTVYTGTSVIRGNGYSSSVGSRVGFAGGNSSQRWYGSSNGNGGWYGARNSSSGWYRSSNSYGW